MSKLMVDINIFDSENIMYLLDEQGNIEKQLSFIDTSILPSVIAKLVQEHNVNYIGINSLDDYVRDIKDEILNKLTTEYSNNNVKVEIIG